MKPINRVFQTFSKKSGIFNFVKNFYCYFYEKMLQESSSKLLLVNFNSIHQKLSCEVLHESSTNNRPMIKASVRNFLSS